MDIRVIKIIYGLTIFHNLHIVIISFEQLFRYNGRIRQFPNTETLNGYDIAKACSDVYDLCTGIPWLSPHRDISICCACMILQLRT